jgi:type VI secretion system protein ImpA
MERAMSDATAVDDPELARLLAPVPGADPCGESLRLTPLFTEVRLAREEDDPSLPMGQWERPLKRADWPAIARLCGDALAGRSKDLQLAAWLLEAWTRHEGLAGLERGLRLLGGLAEGFWDGLYPRIEDGDVDARVAPLEWVNEAISNTLLVHVTLVPLHERKPTRVTLADWQRMMATELGAQGEGAPPPGPDGTPPLTRDEVTANARRYAAPFLGEQLASARGAKAGLAQLVALLDERLGDESPNLSKLANMIEAMERVLVQLQPPAAPPRAAPAAAPVEAPPVAAHPVPPSGGSMESEHSPPHEAAAGAPAAPVQMGQWSNREEAYRTLEALADYLGQIEPHSPTPYLIRRAVGWGRMPLPELFAEIMREEGDLNRMINVLGLQRPE